MKMAPGAFSILAPLLGRKNKKYEKLETDEPNKLAGAAAGSASGSASGSDVKKRQEAATQEEINRLNCKIERLVHSMSRDDIEKAANAEEQCVVCCQARAVMQVAPCGHQSQCRLCFVHNIQEAVASRQLPLRCLLCNSKIMRVKNNSAGGGGSGKNSSEDQPQKFPKSVSGYSLGNGNSNNNNGNGIAHSASNYSMSSGFSSMSASSVGSRGSIKSTTSARSTTSNASWFSIGSLSNFQGGKVIDSAAFSRPPRSQSFVSLLVETLNASDVVTTRIERSVSAVNLTIPPEEAHSLSSCGKARPKPPKNLPNSASNSSIRSWSSAASTTPSPGSSSGETAKTLVPPPTVKITSSPSSPGSSSSSSTCNGLPSPNSIDNRIRAIQGYIRVPTNDTLADEEDFDDDGGDAKLLQSSSTQRRTRLQVTRDNFRRSNSADSDHSGASSRLQQSASSQSLTSNLKPTLMRRLSLGDRSGYHRSGRYSKSPVDLAETTFTMTTIEEENEVTLSLRSLSTIDNEEN